MPSYLRPGVYVEEIAGLGAPRVGPPATVDATTGVALLQAFYAPRPAVFLGLASEGPVGEPVLVESPDQFDWVFGKPVRRSPFGLCVQSFFACGGRQCWVVRAPWSDEGSESGRSAQRVNRSLLDLLEDQKFIEAVEPFSVLTAPDSVITDSDWSEPSTGQWVIHVQYSMINVCQREMSGVALLDAPPHVSIDELIGWRSLTNIDAWDAVMVHPWSRPTVSDLPEGAAAIPSSCALAGLYSTPGGPLGVLSGVEPVTVLDHYDAQRIRGAGVTPMLTTLGGHGRIDDEVRLAANLRELWRGRGLEDSIYDAIVEGTSWAIFRTSTPALWARIETEIASFLDALWRRGHLIGESADAAYDVRCDDGSNAAGDAVVITSVTFQTRPGERRSLRIVHALG